MDKDTKKVQKFIEKKRKKIPQEYNQIELLNELTNPNIDWLVSISNRADGKSFNYINTAIDLAIEFDIKFVLMSRTYMLRLAYMNLIYTIIDKSTDKDLKFLFFKRNEDYIDVYYNDKTIAIITDLNNATDLKYYSNYLKEFPLIIYDEFLAIESDYLTDEWERLQNIYESIDRVANRPYIHNPKILLLGNAVNFNSPLLSELNLFNKLENHPINTLKIYDNIALEMRKNENANEKKNLRAFNSKNNAMHTSSFKMNNYLISSNNKHSIYLEGYQFHIKTSDKFIQVTFNNHTTILSVVAHSTNYNFCSEMKDIKETVIYLNERYYSTNQYKKYDNELYQFENAFSKDYILNFYKDIKINKCISQYLALQESDKNVSRETDNKREQIYEERYLERTKKAIAKKFFS